MKILLICNYKPGVGGISGQVEILQQKLRKEGHAVDIFSTKASVWKRLLRLTKLQRVAKDYDLLHIHCCSGWGFLPAVLGVTVGNRLCKQVVLTYHGGGAEVFFDKHPRLVRKYLSQTDANIVLSGFLANVFKRHALPFVMIPNIVEFDESQFRQRELITPNYICTRAHEPLYNIPCILRAFKRVQQELPQASLTLVGGGSQHKKLMQLADEMKLHNVRFVGKVDNSEIYRYLNQADVMLSAPLIDNMPVSLLEAMNAGLLVVSSCVGGVPYMIEDGKNGLLFESDNDAALAEKMLWVVQHQNEVNSMIASAQQAVKQYQWDNVKKQLYSAYGIHP